MTVCAVKAGVDLDAVEECGVSLQVRTDVGESLRVLAADCPARAADTYSHWRRYMWNIDVQHPTLCSDDAGWAGRPRLLRTRRAIRPREAGSGKWDGEGKGKRDGRQT